MLFHEASRGGWRWGSAGKTERDSAACGERDGPAAHTGGDYSAQNEEAGGSAVSASDGSRIPDPDLVFIWEFQGKKGMRQRQILRAICPIIIKKI